MSFTYSLIGGALIGMAASIMLIFNGRVTGISGIAQGVIGFKRGDLSWRLTFLLGLILGGVVARFIFPQSFSESANLPIWRLILAGFLVGFGALLGSGCTSGHGVCGISRASIRSIVATITFIAVGMLTVFIVGRL